MFVSIAIDWRKKMMDNRMFKKKTILEFILLLSYRKINYGSSGVKRVGMVSIQF